MTQASKPVRSDDEARVLFDDNVKLVPWFVFDLYAKTTKKAEDIGCLLSYVYEELWRACLLWEEDRAKFSTFAVWRMRRALTTYFRLKKKKAVKTVSIDALTNNKGAMLVIRELSAPSREFGGWGGHATEKPFSPELVRILKKKLNEKDISLLVNIYVKGRSYKDVGADRGVSRQAIELQLKRIKKVLGEMQTLRAYKDRGDA